MREVAPDPGGHRFLLKALSEAGNELAEELFGASRRVAERRDADGWSLRLIAAHVRAHEEMVAGYLQRMVSRREPLLEVIDTETMLDEPDSCCDEAEESAMEFARLRHRIQYTLWDLDDRGWDRTGRHPYRGIVTVAQLVRELHVHDLEFLWRARRIKEEVAVRRRS